MKCRPLTVTLSVFTESVSSTPVVLFSLDSFFNSHQSKQLMESGHKEDLEFCWFSWSFTAVEIDRRLMELRRLSLLQHVCIAPPVAGSLGLESSLVQDPKNQLQEDMGIMGLMPIPILGSKKMYLFDISTDIIYIVSAECGYLILVTKICNEGRIFYILTLYSKHQCPEQ